MEDNEKLFKHYIYIEGGNEILNYKDLFVLIDGIKYSYEFKKSDIFNSEEKVILTSIEGKELELEEDLSNEEIDDLDDLERLNLIVKVKKKIRSYRYKKVELEDNIVRFYPCPEFVEEPKVVSFPNKKELDSILAHFKRREFYKPLIILFILAFFFSCSFAYLNQGLTYKIITLVLGILTSLFLLGFLFFYIFDYIVTRKNDWENWQSNYNKYLLDREKYIVYERNYSNYMKEKNRIDETKRRLDIWVRSILNQSVSVLEKKLAKLTNDFICDYQMSIGDYYKLIKIMEDEDIDDVDEGLDRFNEIYCEDDDEEDDLTEEYIKNGSLGRRELDDEIIKLLREQNALLEEQKEEEERKERLSRMLKSKEESKRSIEEANVLDRERRENEKLKEDIRSQCATCRNKPCANAYKTPNCPRYIWSGSKKY